MTAPITTATPVVSTSKERTLLIERYNRLAGAFNGIASLTKDGRGRVNRDDLMQRMLDTIVEQQEVIATLVDLVGNTKARPGD